MKEKYNLYLVYYSTVVTLDRIFLSLKSQFAKFSYEKREFAFVRTEQQIDKIIIDCNKSENSLILIQSSRQDWQNICQVKVKRIMFLVLVF